MALTWDPENSSNWELTYSDQRFEEQREGYLPRRKRIQPFVIPVLISSPLIAIWTDSDGKNDTWNLAGWVRGAIAVPSLINDIKLLNGPSQALQLREATRFDFTANPASSYQLRIFPQRYLPDLRIKVYEYRGPIGDSTEELITVTRVDLARIETRINALL